MEQNKKKV